jgi:hypothetical protein
VTYIGSDEGCGCGFRHALFDKGQWLPVINDEGFDNNLQNHRQLFDFINDNLSDQDIIEIYGCWDGDFSERQEYKEEILLKDLLDTEFHFRERGLYTVLIRKNKC